jgi:hypothetical protein
MRKIYRAYKVYEKQYKHSPLAGFRFICGAVNFLNERPAANNANKGPIRLLMDFSEYVLANK